MKYIIFDMEWNGNQTADGYFNEIIEIGCVMLDEAMNIVDTFQSLVKPKVTKKIRGRIKDLTHITNDDIKNAEGFLTVFGKLKAWIGEGDNCLLSWGNADMPVLYENLKHYNKINEIYAIKHFCDVQLMCQKAMGISLVKQIGLSDFAEMLKIDVSDLQMHRALTDSLITAKCFAQLFTQELYDEFAKVTDSVFYARMNFKCYNILDIYDERLTYAQMMEKCPECSTFMKRFSGFVCKNKKHYALYRCGCCGRQYNVSHAFKMTYDGIVHHSNLTMILKESEEANGESESVYTAEQDK